MDIVKVRQQFSKNNPMKKSSVMYEMKIVMLL